MQFTKLKEKWEREKKEREMRSKEYKETLLAKGIPVFKRYGIKQAVIFGSIQDERAIEGSDIDLFVQPLPNDKYWKFRRDLEESVEFPVDLYTDQDDKIFIDKIISRGEVIYAV